MIQILTYSGSEQELSGTEIKVNKIHDAESLDSFEINIIDLQDANIWRNNDGSYNTINNKADFISVSKMIENSVKAQNIILLPQNYIFRYGLYRGSYQNGYELKNVIYSMREILSECCGIIAIFDFVYENTKTQIGTKELSAAFYFNGAESNALTLSKGSNKPTTIKVDEVIFSTLLIQNLEDIQQFLKKLGLIKEKKEVPKWMEDVIMFDDEKQIEIIRENEVKIQEAKSNIKEAKKAIEKNDEYKSILHTTGDELVKVVLEILEKMLGCDFSEFKDLKNEDFLTTVNEYTFIGEIKGVNHNVKSENVAQLDRHYQGYLDDNPDADETKVNALLIMNHQKNKPVYDREIVHERQVSLARRNGSLIVDTYTLLKLFEQYLTGEKTREACIDILANNTGLLVL